MDEKKEEILDELEPLFERAEEEGLWFYSSYQHMWFSPAELRENHEQGRFVWGKANWELRDPEERLKRLQYDVEEAKRRLELFRARMEE